MAENGKNRLAILTIFRFRRTDVNTLGDSYSNPKWFVEGHPIGVSFHKPKKSTNDIGLLYIADPK